MTRWLPRTCVRTSLVLLGALPLATGCGQGQIAAQDASPGSDGGSPPDVAVSCQKDSDCAGQGVCGFLVADGCSATGSCFPPPGPVCLAYAPGCACDGTEISIACTGLPAGYVSKPLRHAGACTAPVDASADSSNALRWYTTCGDPVCRAPLDGGVSDAGLTDDAGAPCPAVGSACATSGPSCGTPNPYVECGATEICSDHDPKLGVGGCPISSRKFKKDIDYVDGAELGRLRDEVLKIRLATYAYKPEIGDGDRKHLGFVIEDDPRSLAVDSARDRVDLYGYTSMLVAALQVQNKEIAELRRQLAETCSRHEAR